MTPPLIVQLAAQKSVEPDAPAANLADPVPLPEHLPSLPPIVVECIQLRSALKKIAEEGGERSNLWCAMIAATALATTFENYRKEEPQQVQAAT